MSDNTSDRRDFLRRSTLIPLAVATGAVSLTSEAQPAVNCEKVEEHDPVADEDPIFRDARDALWDEFVEGTRATSPNAPAIPQTLKNFIFDEQGKKLKRKMKFWLVCEQQTKNCAYMAGAIAEALRETANDAAITEDQFKDAKRIVQVVQKKVLNRANIGIAC